MKREREGERQRGLRMVCWGGVRGGAPGLGVSSCTISITSCNLLDHSHHHHTHRFLQLHHHHQQQRHVIYYANDNNILAYHNNNPPSTRRRRRWRFVALGSASNAAQDNNNITPAAAAGFCIIEGPETVQDFAKMELQEIHDNVRSRRNKIFLHMEEVRRLRIQQRIKSAELGILNDQQENELPNFPSFIPFLPPLTSSNLKQYYVTCYSLIAGIILFGGLLAPTLELRLGLGGTSYADFIHNMHLPMQLSQVDPIVASFSGGAVGVISALMVVEINNVKQQEQKRCKYCLGAGKVKITEPNEGYLACARCSSTGAIALIEPVSKFSGENQPQSPQKTERCSNCSGSGKVMCPTCLCTGMAMASEHDPRIDPFD